MRVLVPDDPERSLLEPLPDGVSLSLLGEDAPRDDVEFVVADWEAERLRPFLASLPRLRVVQSLSAGVDWLLPSLPGGVVACDARGVHDVPVSEWVLGAVLGSLRGIAGPSAEPGDLEGRETVILGFGSIGEAVAKRIEPFGARVTGVARTARPGVHGLDELDALLPEAEILVDLLPLTDATRGLVNAEVLARLPDGALVVNAGRGPTIDADALLAELRSGRLRAALDVTDPEPLPAGHPLREHALITDHIAGDSPQFLGRAYRLIRDQIERYTRGEELLNIVQDDY